MRETVHEDEDKNAIDDIYFKHRDGNNITKHDELIKMYRINFHNDIRKYQTDIAKAHIYICVYLWIYTNQSTGSI